MYDDKAEMASVKAITITADQEVRISELEHEIRMLKFELEYTKSQLRVAEQKASEIAAQAVVVLKIVFQIYISLKKSVILLE